MICLENQILLVFKLLKNKLTPVLCTTFLYMLTKRSIAPSLPPGDKHYSLGPVGSVKSRRLRQSLEHPTDTYLISSDGRWGRKSLPTKKHMNTQSSMLLSTSNGNGKLAMVSSLSRYYNQRRMLISKQWKEHVWGMPVPIITETYLSKNIQTKEDKLPFCTRKTICKFVML